MDAQFFDDLIVIGSDRPELGMKVGQLGAVIHQCLVHLQRLELPPEEMRLEKDGFRINLLHREKPVPFHIVETHHHTVRLRVQLGIPPVPAALFHAAYHFNLTVYSLSNLRLKNIEIIRLRRIILPTAVQGFSVTQDNSGN